MKRKNKFVFIATTVISVAMTGCVDMKRIEQTTAEQRAAEAQRRSARMAGVSKDRMLRKVVDGKLTTAERLQWLEQVKDNATLYEAFSRVFTEYGESDKKENTVLDAIIRRIDVSTKAEAIKFINWRWKDARNAEGRLAWREQMRKLGNAMCCEKSKTAFAKLNEQDIGAILEDHKLAWGDPCACKQCLHILKSRLSATAQSADMLCEMLTNVKLGGAENPQRIEERLFAKVAEISPEKADVLLRQGYSETFCYLNDEKLIVELIAKLPLEKRGEPMSRLNKFRANKPCIVNGVDWKGLFEIIDGEAVVKRRFTAKWAGYNLPENLVVPCSLAGFPVTRIESEAFCEFKVKRVVVPDSVRSIGREAFGYGHNDREYIAKYRPCAAHLESVVIGSGVTNLEENAFAHCLSLTNVTIRGGTLTVGNGAFKECANLENVTMPIGAHVVFGDEVFKNCVKLKPINGTFAHSVGSTFNGCDSYHDENGFRIIEGVLERYYGNATAVAIPSGVNDIWSRAFADNTKLKTVTIPDGVKRIGPYAFGGCKQLREITIPKSVETIEQKAFMGCVVMRKAVLLNADTEIRDNAFARCANLVTVETPEGKFSPHTWNVLPTFNDTLNDLKKPFNNF